MERKLGKSIAGACALVALLALGACGDTGGDPAAGRDTQATSPAGDAPTGDAAHRAEAQRSGSAEVAQGRGT